MRMIVGDMFTIKGNDTDLHEVLSIAFSEKSYMYLVRVHSVFNREMQFKTRTITPELLDKEASILEIEKHLGQCQ